MRSESDIISFVVRYNGIIAAQTPNSMTFVIPLKTEKKVALNCLAVWDCGWELVKVSCNKTFPSWEAMCYIKQVFWPDDEAVMQIHLPDSQQIIDAKTVHLWRPTDQAIPLPELWMM